MTVFVLNLSEKLSHQPTIEYYGADGKPVIQPHQSSLSHEKILQHCLEAIRIRSQDAQHLIIIVGTHADVAGSCSESIEQKNKKLKELLEAGSFRVLCNSERLDGTIFAVNSKDPQNKDRHVAKILRQKMVCMCPKAIKMPIAWFALEALLRRSSQDGILSIEECQLCATGLHITGDTFSAALHYLVDHNLFLYYREVLPQTVFCDPQVVLSKVSELVEYHHKLLYSPDETETAVSDLVTFRDHGLLSVELLGKFSKHYKEGLFTPQDLLRLLSSVGAIAGISDTVYLMPALLSHLDSEQVFNYINVATALIIRPTHGCIVSGLFCCLVAHLLSPRNKPSWKVCMEGEKPLCLNRNCISFEQKNDTQIVTLVDMFSHIAVRVDQMSSRVCGEIRDCVHRGIKSACILLNCQDVQFEDAFMCGGDNCRTDPPHVAVVVNGNKWKCSSRGRQNGDLSVGQLMWFGESGVTKQGLSATGK